MYTSVLRRSECITNVPKSSESRLTSVLGYFAVNHANMGGLQTFFGQLWKEYALSDSRYLTQNSFVFCVESMTAVRFVFHGF